MSSKGFSLIELMIAIALVGILAAIAYPSYQDSVKRSRRADAHAAILGLQLAQERVRGDCPFYAQVIDDTIANDVCGSSGATTKVRADDVSPDEHYDLALTSASGNSYTITATPVTGGRQESDTACLAITLTVNAENPKGARAPSACW